MEKYYLKYKNDVFRFVLSIVKDKYLAEDITQECFLKLFEKQKKHQGFFQDKNLAVYNGQKSFYYIIK